MNKAFIFDWSGTLSDNFHCFVRICDLIFADYGLKPISKEEIRLNFDTPYMKFWNKYIPEQTQAEHHSLYTKYSHQVGDPELYPGVLKIINQLHNAGYKLFILSSDHPSKLIPEIDKSGLANLFIKVISSVHDKREALLSLSEEFKLEKEFTFYVGDTAGDVEAGKYAGVKTIGISWGFQHQNILLKSQPDFLINDILEIEKIINN